jgi:hypothetical protein
LSFRKSDDDSVPQKSPHTHIRPLPGSKASLNVQAKVNSLPEVTVEYVENVKLEQDRPFRVSLPTATSGMVSLDRF